MKRIHAIILILSSKTGICQDVTKTGTGIKATAGGIEYRSAIQSKNNQSYQIT